MKRNKLSCSICCNCFDIESRGRRFESPNGQDKNIAKNKFEWVFIIIFVICAEPQRQHKLPIKQSLWASLTCQNICASMLQTKQDKTSLPCLASLPMEYITIFKLQDSPFKKERVVRRNSTARWLANSKKKNSIVKCLLMISIMAVS